MCSFFTEAATRSVLLEKVASACNFTKKETLAQVFSCEFCEISWNTFFRNTEVLLIKTQLVLNRSSKCAKVRFRKNQVLQKKVKTKTEKSENVKQLQ